MPVALVTVRHASPHGPDYTQTWSVKIATTLDDAVRSCGAVPPQGVKPRIRVQASRCDEIVYSGDVLPVCLDPAAVVLELVGLQGGLYVPVPYKCTRKKLTAEIIPARLRLLGVHPHDVRGAIRGSVHTGHLVPRVTWTKLQVPVAFSWPLHVLRGVRSLQRLWREQKKEEDDEWCVLQQGIEPWTNSS